MEKEVYFLVKLNGKVVRKHFTDVEKARRFARIHTVDSDNYAELYFSIVPSTLILIDTYN